MWRTRSASSVTNRLGPMQHGDPGGRVSALVCLCSREEPDKSELLFQEDLPCCCKASNWATLTRALHD
jgi:hypothetical protein